MSNWFESWFNTEEYLHVYKHRNESEALKNVQFILEYAKTPPGGSVLDMACGPGRHSIILSRLGYKVTAVDLSDNLLCVARNSAAAEGLDIKFVKSDLRDIKLDNEFDLAVNLFTSFGYFEDDDENYKIFDVALSQLAYNGTFVIDFFNINHIRKNLREYSEDSILGRKIIQRRSIVGKRIVKKIEINSDKGNKFFYESVRMFTPEELINALNDRGLFVNRIFGDFSGNPFDPDKSERIIIFAVK